MDHFTKETNQMSTFSERLKEQIKKRGTSAGELADKVGVNPQTFMSWLDGSKQPYDAVRQSLCKALECSEDELFGNKKAEKKQDSISEVMPKPQEPAKTGTTEAENKQVKTEQPQKNKPIPQPKEDENKGKDKSGIKDIISVLSKNMKPMPKPVSKTADSQTLKTWCDSYKEAVSANISAAIDALLTVSEKEETVPAKYKKLLDAAENASDEAIELAISVLKKCR